MLIGNSWRSGRRSRCSAERAGLRYTCAFAILAAISCRNATAPVRLSQGPPVSTATVYLPVVIGPSGAPVVRLTIHSVFLNVQSQPVYVHQWCDQQFGGDTTTSPWVNLTRTGTDTTIIGYEYGGCYLAGGIRPAAAHSVAPGDSIVSDLTFPAILNHALTPADSASLSGKMRLEYVVTWMSASPMSARDLLPEELRTSAPFTVLLPR